MNIILLAKFAPLIQLWSGIYLSCLYEPIIKNFPLEKYEKKRIEVFENFVNKFQGLLEYNSEETKQTIKTFNWGIVYEAIQHISTLSFIYCLLVLSYIGIEDIHKYINYYCVLQVTDFLVIIYIIFAIIFYKRKFFRNIVTAIIISIFIFLFFHCFETMNNYLINKGVCFGYFLNQNLTSVLTLFTICLSPFFLCIFLIYEFTIIQYKKNRILKLSVDFEYLVNIQLGIPNEHISKKEKKRLANHLIENNFDKNTLPTFASNRIKKQFKYFTNPWYTNIYQFFNNWKNHNI